MARGPVHRSMFPIRVFLERVILPADPGTSLFPCLQRSNINRIPKRAIARAVMSEGSCYSSRASRRGDAQEISRSGASMGAILRAGGWGPGRY